MDSLAEYPRGVVTEVVEELTGLRERFLAAGVLPQNLILDPGLLREGRYAGLGAARRP